jgi:hypothetical protein
VRTGPGLANLAAGSIDDLTRVTKNRLKRMQYRPTLANGVPQPAGAVGAQRGSNLVTNPNLDHVRRPPVP